MATRAKRSTSPAKGRAVAITGAAGTLGRLVVQSLAQEGSLARVVALVHQAKTVTPHEHPTPVQSHRVDLTDPTADARLADVLRREHIDTLVHASFLSKPAPDAAFGHELEVIGTLHVLTAARAAGVRRVILLGRTMSYGAHPQNPAHLQEDAPLRGAPGFPFVQDKVEAETEAARFASAHSKPTVTVLRLCPLLGAGMNNLWSNYFRRMVAPTVLGFDPLMQFLHPADALRAIRLAVSEDLPGAFNIVGRGVVPLSTAIRMAGAVTVPVPRLGARAALAGLRAAGVTQVVPHLADFLTYPFVADGTKAAQHLGFVPQYGPRETLLQLLGAGPALHVVPPSPSSAPGDAHG